MARIALFVLCGALFSGCAGLRSQHGIGPETQRAMRQLRIGMSDKDTISLMRPVCADWGRMYWEGSGASWIYFQVSSTQRVWLEADGAPSFAITAISRPEPKTKWTRRTGGSITVE